MLLVLIREAEHLSGLWQWQHASYPHLRSGTFSLAYCKGDMLLLLIREAVHIVCLVTMVTYFLSSEKLNISLAYGNGNMLLILIREAVHLVWLI